MICKNKIEGTCKIYPSYEECPVDCPNYAVGTKSRIICFTYKGNLYKLPLNKLQEVLGDLLKDELFHVQLEIYTEG